MKDGLKASIVIRVYDEHYNFGAVGSGPALSTALFQTLIDLHERNPLIVIMALQEFDKFITN